MASRRTVLNLSRLDAIQQALAVGMGDGLRVILDAASAKVKDVPKLGVGIKYAGGYLVYANGKKVAEGSVTGVAVSPSSSMKVSKGQGLYGYIGFGRPARFLEVGTSDTAAQPFLSPTVLAMAPTVLPEHMKAAVAPLTGP